MDDDDGIDSNAEHDEWVAEQRRERNDEMRRIETNDPTFTTLEIREIHSYGLNYNWGELGTAIGRNTPLTALIVNAGGNISAIDFRDFARGLAFNQSIQKLSIAGWDHSNL